ncbi:hypothetical protein BKA62DRAFT_834349 [Auriculariales sp. MPI-PUGE-AT-0066]|nr:hypothetical protein BKA62DRAFT_834349 [Auriculariales sp. MPI-PUGE-AT-0066]
MFSPQLAVVAAVFAGSAHAVLSSGTYCIKNSVPVGDYCASGLACVEQFSGGYATCAAFNCATTLAPSTVTSLPAKTVTAGTATVTGLTTVAVGDLCACNPQTIYTTTVQYPSTLPKPTATLGVGEICASATAACQPGLGCFSNFPNSRCQKATCINAALPTKTVTSQSTITAAPVTTTVLQTVSTKSKTNPQVTCSCTDAPTATTTTIYQYV